MRLRVSRVGNGVEFRQLSAKTRTPVLSSVCASTRCSNVREARLHRFVSFGGQYIGKANTNLARLDSETCASIDRRPPLGQAATESADDRPTTSAQRLVLPFDVQIHLTSGYLGSRDLSLDCGGFCFPTTTKNHQAPPTDSANHGPFDREPPFPSTSVRRAKGNANLLLMHASVEIQIQIPDLGLSPGSKPCVGVAISVGALGQRLLLYRHRSRFLEDCWRSSSGSYLVFEAGGRGIGRY